MQIRRTSTGSSRGRKSNRRPRCGQTSGASTVSWQVGEERVRGEDARPRQGEQVDPQADLAAVALHGEGQHRDAQQHHRDPVEHAAAQPAQQPDRRRAAGSRRGCRAGSAARSRAPGRCPRAGRRCSAAGCRRSGPMPPKSWSMCPLQNGVGLVADPGDHDRAEEAPAAPASAWYARSRMNPVSTPSIMNGVTWWVAVVAANRPMSSSSTSSRSRGSPCGGSSPGVSASSRASVRRMKPFSGHRLGPLLHPAEPAQHHRDEAQVEQRR